MLAWLTCMMGVHVRCATLGVVDTWFATAGHVGAVGAAPSSGVTIDHELLSDIVSGTVTQQVLLGVLQHIVKGVHRHDQRVHQHQRQPSVQSECSPCVVGGVHAMAGIFVTIQVRVRCVQHSGAMRDDGHDMHIIHGHIVHKLL